MNYVVQVTLMIHTPTGKPEDGMRSYLSHKRVTTMPATSEKDARDLCEAIGMTANRTAEVCISVPNRNRGSVILPLERIGDVLENIERDRHQASQDQQDREASTIRSSEPAFRKPYFAKPAAPAPGDD